MSEFKTTLWNHGDNEDVPVVVDYDYERGERQSHFSPAIVEQVSINSVVDEGGNDIALTDGQQRILSEEILEFLADERDSDREPPERDFDEDKCDEAARRYEANLQRDRGDAIQ